MDIEDMAMAEALSGLILALMLELELELELG
jgi:hypothetical protein